jgi:flagellar motor protein MotB
VFKWLLEKVELRQIRIHDLRHLQANPQTQVFVIGHTDNKGTLNYNLGLSSRRASGFVLVAK